MDVRSLECFVVLAEELHFRRAAARLHLTQPALSQRLKVLEAQIGALLLKRDRRSAELTAAGVAFLGSARLAVVNAERALNQARLAMRGETGGLKLGFTVLAAYGIVPEAVRLFRERHAAVAVELGEMNSPLLEEALLAGDVDLAVLHPPMATPGLSMRPLPDEPLVLALPQDHALARKDVVAISDLDGEALLAAPRAIGPNLYDRFIALFQSQGVSPRIVQEVTPMPTLASFVAAGVGIGFVTAGIAASARAGVVFRPTMPPPPGLPMALAWHGPTPSPTAARFIAVAEEIAGTAIFGAARLDWSTGSGASPGWLKS